MAFASVEAPSKRGAKFTDKTMVGDAEIAEFECKTDKMSEEVGSVDTTINKNGAVDIGVGECAKR